MLGICTTSWNTNIITYYHNVHTTLLVHTILLGEGEGEGGKGGPQVSDCEGFPLAPSRLAARLA